MTEEKALARVETGEPSSKELAELQAFISQSGNDLSPMQVKLSWVYAQKRGLDIIAGQITPTIIRGRLTMITRIDGFRVIAERSGDYAGQDPIKYETDENGTLTSATATVYRHSWGDRGLSVTAYWDEFAPESGKDYTWKKMPHVMLGKVAEAQALRKAFPNDMSGMYTDDEMAQAGHQPEAIDAEVVPVATPAPPEPDRSEDDVPGGDIEPDQPGGDTEPDPPEWGEHKMKVREAPDGLRVVKTPDWYKDTDAKKIDKLEIRGKYGRRNVTVILLGDIAGYADAHLELLFEGVQFVTDGERYEYEWQEGKPKALQVRHVTKLAINTGDRWVHVQDAGPQSEPEVVEGEFSEVPPEVPDPPAPPEPEPLGKAGSAGASSSSPEADTNTAPDSGASGETTPTSGDLREAAAEVFADLMPDADVDPARGGNPQVGAGWEELPVMPAGETGSVVTLEGYFAKGAIVDVPGAPGKHMFDGWLTSQGMDRRIHVLMSEAAAQQAGVERLGAGEEVYVRGTWRLPGGEPVVLADTLRPA